MKYETTQMRTSVECVEMREAMRQVAREVMAMEATGMVAEMMRNAAMEEMCRKPN